MVQNIRAGGVPLCPSCSKKLSPRYGTVVYLGGKRVKVDRAELRKLRGNGWSVTELAARFDITHRSVTRLLAA